MRKSRAVAVSALLAVAAVNLLAACTPEDDSDVFPTPENPEPEPEPEFHCQIVWASQNEQTPANIDVFVLDAPEEVWVGGVNTFGGFTAFYQPDLDFHGNHVLMALDTRAGLVVDSSDSFALTLTLNRTLDGADVAVMDSGANTIYAVDSAGEASEVVLSTSNSFEFEGVWSSREPDTTLELGEGLAEILLMMGTSATLVQLGDYGSFAVCYDLNAEEAHASAMGPVREALKRLRR